MMALLAGGARADAPAPEDPIGAIGWDGVTFVPKNLGSLKLDEKAFVKITQYPRGLAFQSNGDLLATLGSGTTPLMEITKWTGTTPSTFVKFQWHDYTPADFKNADKMKELSKGEAQGIFWFFGGPLAVNGKIRFTSIWGPAGQTVSISSCKLIRSRCKFFFHPRVLKLFSSFRMTLRISTRHLFRG